MTRHGNLKTTVSALVGSALTDAQGAFLGRVHEFAVLPGDDSSRVLGFLIKPSGKRNGNQGTLAQIKDVERSAHGLRLRNGTALIETPQDAALVLLERDLLDQQIIDVHGRKVVRVNDVHMDWEETSDSTLALRIVEVEVGLRGAVRRLLKGLPVTTVDRLACRFSPSVIPWEFVDLIDPARRVRLKVDQDHLSQMHPSDIADILEELAPPERQALFRSLNEEVAAETLEEVEPKLQKSLIQSLDSEQVAGIVEEMDPGAAADLLAELSEEKSEAILEEMDPEERQEVEELLEFSQDSAAGRMTTEYVALPATGTTADVHTAIRQFEGDIELITDIYLLDAEERPFAVIPIVHVLLAASTDLLSDLTRGHLVTCQVDTSGRKVAELFDKYNLRSLPVVDTDRRLVGVVHAEQVIALLREK